ncbi:MAG: PAS domain S-box protein, partial [Rhodospirillales bacterium]|nr:PAS domain S-box protein [Rhodospirillales bacterium]
PPGFLRVGLSLEDIIRYRTERGEYGAPTSEKPIEEIVQERFSRGKSMDEFIAERTLPNGTTCVHHRRPMPGGGCVVTYTDITDRKAAEHQVAEKSHVLEATFDNMVQGIAVYDKNHVLGATNPQYSDILGLPSNFVFVGMDRSDILRYRAEFGHYGDGDIDALINEQLATTGEQESSERTLPDGRSYLYERVPTPDGGYISTVTDITERKATEHQVAEKSRILEATFDNMAQGIAVFDSAHTLVAFNAQYGEILGLPSDYLQVGFSRREILQFRAQQFHHDGLDGDTLIEKKIAGAMEPESSDRVLPNGNTYSYHRIPTPDGGYIATVTDTTERTNMEREQQESDRKFRAAFNNAGVGISIRSNNGKTREHNDTLSKMLGYTEEELQSIRLTELAHPDDDPNITSLRMRTPQETNDGVIERRFIRKDGHIIWCIITYKVVFDEQGVPLYTIAMYQDITERKINEEGIQAAKEEAEFANRSKSEFLANMSHELRTPLNAVIGFSEVIIKESFGPIGNQKYKGYIEDIHSSGQHLLGLITDILDLSKVEAGKTKLHEEDIDPVDIARACLSMVRSQARNNAIDLVLDIPDQLPWLFGDQLVLKQIVLNLLTNAIKFSNEGGTVTLKGWSQTKSGFVFQVIDTGIGVALEDIPKIMQPFIQIESAMSRKHQGTGLGLPLVKRMVELHGGSIDIQSEL